MKIYINKDFFVEGHYIKDATEIIEITNNQWEKIKVTPKFNAWKYDFESDTFELCPILDLDVLRLRREEECFATLSSKCLLWWKRLSNSQLLEVEDWYQKWLDVTETLEIPEIPKWMK